MAAASSILAVSLATSSSSSVFFSLRSLPSPRLCARLIPQRKSQRSLSSGIQHRFDPPKPAVSNVCKASRNEVNRSALLADRSAYGNTSATRKVYANERAPLNTSCSTPLRKKAALAKIRRSFKILTLASSMCHREILGEDARYPRPVPADPLREDATVLTAKHNRNKCKKAHTHVAPIAPGNKAVYLALSHSSWGKATTVGDLPWTLLAAPPREPRRWCHGPPTPACGSSVPLLGQPQLRRAL